MDRTTPNSPEIERGSAQRIHVPLLTAVIVISSIFRIGAYCGNRSMWLDEALLANNICSRTFGGLCHPLDNGQAAPIGFLLLEKLATRLMGNSEYGLRFVPLIASIATLPLLYLFVRTVLDKYSALLATALMGVMPSQIYYASEAKQYSTDIAVCAALLYLAARYTSRPTQARATALAVLGATAVWLSHPSIFVMGSIWLWLLVVQGRQRNKLILISLTWVVGLAADYLLQIRAINRVGMFFDYWQFAFLPVPPRSFADLHQAISILIGPFEALFHSDAPPRAVVGIRQSMLVATFWLIGCVILWNERRRNTLLLLVLPIAAAAAASAMHRYPFSGRLTLFLSTPMVVPISLAIIRLVASSERPARVAGYVAALALFLLPSVQAADMALHRPEHEAIRPAIAFVQSHRQEGDVLVISRWAVPVYGYYHTYRLMLVDMHAISLSETSTPSSRSALLGDLRQRRRIWVLYSHSDPADGNGGLITSDLRATIEPTMSYEAEGAGVYLFTPRP